MDIVTMASINEASLNITRLVARQTALKVAKDTDGIVEYSPRSAEELSNIIKMVDNAIDHEFKRRYEG